MWVSADLNKNDQITEKTLGYHKQESPLQYCVRHSSLKRLVSAFLVLVLFFRKHPSPLGERAFPLHRAEHSQEVLHACNIVGRSHRGLHLCCFSNRDLFKTLFCRLSCRSCFSFVTLDNIALILWAVGSFLKDFKRSYQQDQHTLTRQSPPSIEIFSDSLWYLYWYIFK